MFYLWDNKLNYKLRDLFETRQEAEIQATKYANITGYEVGDFVIKERDDSPEYVEARLLLSDGTLPAPVWADAYWYQARMDDINVFDHVDIENPDSVLYYENKNKLAKNRPTRIKPGRFLKKYFADILSEDDILKWTDRHKEQWVDGATISWARTPEEIVAVYEMSSTFGSCMQHKFNPPVSNTAGWKMDLPVHPTYVYGAGDLSVAYLHKGGRLLGRALVWEEKKLVGRVYGDIVGMRAALRKAGIVTDSDQHTYDTFEGARLLHIPYPYSEQEGEWVYKEQPRVVCPYIDGSVDGLTYSEDGKYLILTDQKWDDDFIKCENPTKFKATEPAGYIYGTCTCIKCGKEKRSFGLVLTKDEKGENTTIWWCNNCRDYHASFSYSTGLYYDRDVFTQRTVYKYGYWGESAHNVIEGVDDIVYSELEFLWRFRGEATQLATGEWVGNHKLINFAFKSAIDGKFYRRSSKVIPFGVDFPITEEQEKALPEGTTRESFIATLDIRNTNRTLRAQESLFGSWL